MKTLILQFTMEGGYQAIATFLAQDNAALTIRNKELKMDNKILMEEYDGLMDENTDNQRLLIEANELIDRADTVTQTLLSRLRIAIDAIRQRDEKLQRILKERAERCIQFPEAFATFETSHQWRTRQLPLSFFEAELRNLREQARLIFDEDLMLI